MHAIKLIISYCNDNYTSKAGKVEKQQNTNEEEEQTQLVQLIRSFKISSSRICSRGSAGKSANADLKDSTYLHDHG